MRPESWFTRAAVMMMSFFVLCTGSCEKRNEPVGPAGKVRVIATLFVLYDFAKNVGGRDIDVRLLVPPGVEPHTFEPKPGDILKLQKADILLYTGSSMEPWVEKMTGSLEPGVTMVVDTGRDIQPSAPAEDSSPGDGHEHGKQDPHLWLDFSNAQAMVDTILHALTEKDPAHAQAYRANADAYKERLADLDSRYRNALSTCEKRVIIHGGHSAFGYLARRYRLQYVSAYRGFSPDAEPTPKHLAELSAKMKQYGLKYVYQEELLTPRVAETIAKETGAKLLLLHGAHNVTKEEMERGVSFLSLMERNLENLRIGLQCR